MLLWVQKRVPCERLASSDHCVLDYQLAATRKYNTKILVAIVFFIQFFEEFCGFGTLHPRRLLRLLRLEPPRTLSG